MEGNNGLTCTHYAYNLRSMRTKSTLDPLLSRTTQQILAAILLERKDPWYFTDWRSGSAARRPLSSGRSIRSSEPHHSPLERGKPVYFEREPDCPILPELQGILTKTVDWSTSSAKNFGRSRRRFGLPLSRVRRQGEERAESDVDLMVIGSATLSDLSPALAKSEKRLGPVNATVYPPREFLDKTARKNHFLRSVLAAEKIFVLGSEHELEELTEPGKSRPARHKQSGTGRSPRRR